MYVLDKGFGPGNTFFISTCLTSTRGSAVKPTIQRRYSIGQRGIDQGILLTNKDLPQTHGQNTSSNPTISPQSMCKAQNAIINHKAYFLRCSPIGTDRDIEEQCCSFTYKPPPWRPEQQLGNAGSLGARVSIEFNQSYKRSFWELGSAQTDGPLLLVAERTQPRIGQSWCPGRSECCTSQGELTQC